MLTVATPLGNTTHFDYFGGEIVRVTDPTGNGSTMNYDLAGRLIAQP